MTLRTSRLTRRGMFVLAGAAFAFGLAGQPTLAADIDDLHFLIPGGAGGGWDGTARGTGAHTAITIPESA